MTELQQAMKCLGKMSTAIIRYDNGQYGLVGNMPIELTYAKPSMYNPDQRVSRVWNSEGEAIEALLEIGVDRFQLSDCSWYDDGVNEKGEMLGYPKED